MGLEELMNEWYATNIGAEGADTFNNRDKLGTTRGKTGTGRMMMKMIGRMIGRLGITGRMTSPITMTEKDIRKQADENSSAGSGVFG